jgi:choline dehydrogenase-like flavoprotein
MLAAALSPDKTPFDYIIVGSGAGGGPLAARLAKAGRRVLLLDSGTDAASTGPGTWDASIDPPEVHWAPGYHAAATEDPKMSWSFSVRHYHDSTQQQKDSKYSSERDQSGTGGIFYPRCSALGGCTAHHAMIIVAPNDRDWDQIAERTGDDSWRAASMQGYFARIEKCLYRTVYQDFFRRLFGLVYGWALRVVAWVNPRAVWDEGGHGFQGWQSTSFINPDLVAQIKKGDRTFRNVLVEVIEALLGEQGALSAFKRALWQLRLVQVLDPNDRNNRRSKPEGVSFIPIGTDGIRRMGVREFLLKTQKEHPDRLVIVTETHATRILFEPGADQVPVARGVEVATGSNLYQASPMYQEGSPARHAYFATREVIICGGSFNTPQLLMLSGIGDQEHLQAVGTGDLHGIDRKPFGRGIHLPGVGLNLQDRYEVTVINELNGPFSTLDNVSFIPGDSNDPARSEWLNSSTGLYTTNGGTVAVLKRSGVQDDKPEPDLFIFGAPVAFRGYYWGWSRDLLHKDQRGTVEQRNLWSWIILKAYTSNTGGSVRLRSDSPFDTPAICFASFAEGPAGWEKDLAAVADAVKFVRQVNNHPKTPFQNEVQPGQDKPDESDALNDWIKDEAWGHHACGTCRLGSDPWRANIDDLLDRSAVLDSKFKVHGVRNLRVVDASVFPTIPGYFLVTPVFMVSEKAADTILAETVYYPEPLQALENEAVKSRRAIAQVPSSSENAVGLAFSGGGIRSATFNLGILQALAKENRLRDIDFLSTVSGGGYLGGFLGRLFTRIGPDVVDKVGRVQEMLVDLDSPQIRWLRSTANYLAGNGLSDLRRNLAAFWRNLFAVHLVIAALLIASFGVLKWIGDSWLQRLSAGALSFQGLPLSPWFWFVLLVLWLGALPGSLGVWLTPRRETRDGYPFYPFLAWLILLGGGVGLLIMPGGAYFAAGFIVLLVVSYLWQEAARWNLPPSIKPAGRGVVIRSKLTIALGEVIFILAGALFWAVLDTIARCVVAHGTMPLFIAIMVALAPFLPIVRFVAHRLNEASGTSKKSGSGRLPFDVMAGIIAFSLATLLLLIADMLAESGFAFGISAGWFMVVVLVLFSLAIGREFNFLNLSSLQALHAARLTRTFLGASNPERLFGTGTSVLLSHPEDDIALDQYHPEAQGGPLHLINVCLNETAIIEAERDVRERKGLPMCIGPAGVSVGRRFHGIWTEAEAAVLDPERTFLSGIEKVTLPQAKSKVALRSIPAGEDPSSFHVFGRRDGKPAAAERLRLGQWIGISGAAIGTASGFARSLAMSLVFGLLNVRLGYWWNSGISGGERSGFYPKSLWQQIKSLPALLFRTQSMIVSEWRAYFRGPSERFWYLSDGGHFEATGMYELVRRRLPFIILVDAGDDPHYQYNDLARCMRLIRMDFRAELQWLDPSKARAAGTQGWAAFGGEIPNWITSWLDPEMIGCRQNISRTGSFHAAIGQIRYTDGGTPDSWVLLIKPSLTGDESLDVLQYSTQDLLFPNSPTTNQTYDDSEWESYRELGEHVGTKVFSPSTHLYRSDHSNCDPIKSHAPEALCTYL